MFELLLLITIILIILGQLLPETNQKKALSTEADRAG